MEPKFLTFLQCSFDTNWQPMPINYLSPQQQFIIVRMSPLKCIKEGEFGKIQKDREQEMKYWSDRFRTVQKDEKELKVGIRYRSRQQSLCRVWSCNCKYV
jgi:hypothetical protein